ncbi:hypothetical protein H072_8577 [Dactylellina haptotyla CBS 200.50]|uniref:Queuine tRNA-ribosyltransferase accessory subunit 2 n=1 Tax=Dactylellina haptotyla (strain CBS 200.50) TaxID=1284197 RepID=S8A4H7_DACHA|nr:hypothetical protein H072_8577 [Dactylellina haptotyla CBS 200.50]
MNTFRVLKTAVTDVATGSAQSPGARIGVLQLSKGFTLNTPNYLAPTSRGAVPHLSPDNLEKHTRVVGVYVALEDFIEKAPQRTPPLYTYPSTLREFISLPADTFLLLAPRRSPAISCPKPNSDANLSILTSVGFRDLPIKDYVSAVVKLQPDIVLGIADVPNTDKPVGKNRVRKVAERTEKWLDELLGRIDTASLSFNSSIFSSFDTTAAEGGEGKGGEVVVEGGETKKQKKEGYKPAVFAAVLPVDKEKQRIYINYLADNVEKLAGVVFTSPESAGEMIGELPEELEGLARLQADVSQGPHEVLEMVDLGIDIFNLSFAGLATDAGIALHFTFGTPEGEKDGEEGGVLLDQLDLATDMWDEKFATDLGPLEDGCMCYACTKHHKAFVRHCLSAKEMTAWVLLQIHNMWVVEKFFADVRKSIELGTWEAEKERFRRRYKRDLPDRTGLGPRLRGYQYKSAGGDKKLNESAYRSLDAPAPEEADVPEVDGAELQKSGFAQTTTEY